MMGRVTLRLSNWGFAIMALILPLSAQFTDGTVKSFQKISDTEGGFTYALNNTDGFGRSISSIGDLNRDGVPDMAVGAPLVYGSGSSPGALYILFMNSDGSVKASQKIRPQCH